MIKNSKAIAAAASAIMILGASAMQASAETASVAPGTEAPHGGYVELGTAKDWTAIRFKLEGNKVCAIYSRPKSSKVTGTEGRATDKRGERAAFVTWEDGKVDASKGVASFLLGARAGNPAKGNSAEIDGKKSVTLYGFDDRLYPSHDEDKKMMDAMRMGSSMVVTAPIEGNLEVEDTYSLMGVQAAIAIARKDCSN